MIIPCPKCKHRLFSIYVGGAKEMVHDKLWCKYCKQIHNVSVKIIYSKGGTYIKSVKEAKA